ncbi:required for drug-induced death protein 1 [Elgaria multicarinata webbii]|uniref:required for drug-induced death protein 1 n=1 Tax=Elgaria multicarinata webbii TaxID=159646 RepID=UPI002FCD50A6
MTVGGTLRAERPRRRGPADDKIAILEGEEEEEKLQQQRATLEGEDGPGWPSKKVAFAFLPDNYQPLGWGGEAAQEAERKSKKRRRKLKKYGKNVGKALRKGCHFLVLGLQGLANAYSSPFGVAVSVVTTFR